MDETDEAAIRKKRWAVVLVCCLVAIIVYGARQSDQLPLSPMDSVHAVTAQDIQVYQSFLAHHPHMFLVGENSDPHVFVNSTFPSGRFPSLSQYLNFDQQPRKSPPYWEQYDDKYNDLRNALYTRNEKSVPIPQFATPAHINIGSEYRFLDSDKDILTACNMYFSLPAYDMSNTTALLVVYSETDNSGSPTCIYVMRRHADGKSWYVNNVEWDGGADSILDR